MKLTHKTQFISVMLSFFVSQSFASDQRFEQLYNIQGINHMESVPEQSSMQALDVNRAFDSQLTGYRFVDPMTFDVLNGLPSEDLMVEENGTEDSQASNSVVASVPSGFSVQSEYEQRGPVNPITESEEQVSLIANELQNEIDLAGVNLSTDSVIAKWQDLEPKLQTVIAKEKELNELLEYFKRLKRIQENR